MPIVPQSPVNVSSSAYRFGMQDAQENAPFAPESIFIRRSDQILYAHGFEAVRGVNEATAQFTGNPLPKPSMKPHYKADDDERVRLTDLDADKVFKASERRAKRMARALAETAAFLGVDDGEILFA